MFPDDCIQSIVGADNWWVQNEDRKLCRGALIFAFAPHIDQIPYTFEPIGRKDPTDHSSAVVRVAPLKIDQPLKPTDLPVAAMTLHSGEVWAAYRAKRRPCLVISCGNPVVDAALTKGMSSNATAPTCLIAPYYGANRTQQRAGYQPAFVERVRHCEYPQFFWDHLPIDGGEESILRLDHIQPIGAHYKAYKPSPFKLSEGALEVMDEILTWLVRGGVEKDSLITLYRQEIESIFGSGKT
jgi:hypothetical protein